MHLEFHFAVLLLHGYLLTVLVCVLNRLESEKTVLISDLNKLHKEKEVWAIQRSELQMTQAELSAENTQLRRELNSKVLV